MIGCRNCEQRTDGDCGAHGTANAPMYPCAERADRLPLDATAAANVEAILREHGATFAALADVPPGTQRAIHGLWAELAAEREKRAAREGRLREALLGLRRTADPDCWCRPAVAVEGDPCRDTEYCRRCRAAIAEPADDSASEVQR